MFSWKNWKFSLILGGIYTVMWILLTLWEDDVLLRSSERGLSWSVEILTSVASGPMFLGVALAFLAACVACADHTTFWGRAILGSVHGVFHLLLVLGLVSLMPLLNGTLLHLSPGDLRYFLASALEMTLLGGFLGGVIWGLYLLCVNATAGFHYNDAFSAMHLAGYKNFLRMCIKEDTLTVFPIGLERTPKRSGWQVNKHAEAGDQDQPMVVPKKELNPILIEGPIVIDVNGIE